MSDNKTDYCAEEAPIIEVTQTNGRILWVYRPSKYVGPLALNNTFTPREYSKEAEVEQ